MAVITFYRNDGIAANGHTYTYNRKHYGAFAASNHQRLGTTGWILPSRSGGFHRVHVVIVDRLGSGTDYDLSVPAARKAMGPKYEIIGRFTGRFLPDGWINVRKKTK